MLNPSLMEDVSTVLVLVQYNIWVTSFSNLNPQGLGTSFTASGGLQSSIAQYRTPELSTLWKRPSSIYEHLKRLTLSRTSTSST